MKNRYGLDIAVGEKVISSKEIGSVTDLILEIRYALEADINATCYGYKLKPGCKALGADAVYEDELVIVDNEEEVFEVETYSGDELLGVGCVNFLEDARLVKQWAEEEGIGARSFYFEDDFTTEDFITKTDYVDFWCDYLADEVKL